MYSSKHYAAKSEKSSIKSEDFAKQSEEFAAQASEATNARWNIFDVVAKDYEIPYEAKWGFEPLGQYVYKSAAAGEHYGYPDFYETCIRELNECPEGEETVIGNFSVTLYKHPNGHIFYNDFVEGEFVDGIFGEQGEAWYYGIDMENEKIKLPRSTKRFEDLPEGSVLYMVVGNVKNEDFSWVDIVTQVDKGVKDITDTEAEVLENIQQAEEVVLENIQRTEEVVLGNIDEYTADIKSASESIARYQQPIVPIEQTSGVVNLNTTNIYTMVIDGDTSFVLPTDMDTRFYNQIQLSVQIIGRPAVDWGTDIRFNREPIEIDPGFYDFHFDYDNLQQAWVVGYMSKGTVE